MVMVFDFQRKGVSLFSSSSPGLLLFSYHHHGHTRAWAPHSALFGAARRRTGRVRRRGALPSQRGRGRGRRQRPTPVGRAGVADRGQLFVQVFQGLQALGAQRQAPAALPRRHLLALEDTGRRGSAALQARDVGRARRRDAAARGFRARVAASRAQSGRSARCGAALPRRRSRSGLVPVHCESDRIERDRLRRRLKSRRHVSLAQSRAAGQAAQGEQEASRLPPPGLQLVADAVGSAQKACSSRDFRRAPESDTVAIRLCPRVAPRRPRVCRCRRRHHCHRPYHHQCYHQCHHQCRRRHHHCHRPHYHQHYHHHQCHHQCHHHHQRQRRHHQHCRHQH